MISNDDLQRAAAWLAEADQLVVTAGAGLGTDSGLPDFRGAEGFWQAYPALGRQGLRFTDIAQPAAFEATPRLAWGFYGHRLTLYRSTVPHAGFDILRRWGAGRAQPAWVFTSNVDGQFQQAGFDPGHLVECHGSIHLLQCAHDCCDEVWSAEDLLVRVDEAACEWLGPLPACPHCGGLARPNILMFGDADWLGERYEARERRLLKDVGAARRPLVIEIGAGTAVPSVRRFGEQVLGAHEGARLLRINPREAQVSVPRALGLAGGALATLQALDALSGAAG